MAKFDDKFFGVILKIHSVHFVIQLVLNMHVHKYISMKKRSFSMVTLLGLFLFLLLSSNKCSHEDNVVTGKVFPAGMTVPMRDVAVKIKGDDSSVVLTDGNGFFKIDVPLFPVELEFSKETYRTQLVTVKKASDIVIYMIAGS